MTEEQRAALVAAADFIQGDGAELEMDEAKRITEVLRTLAEPAEPVAVAFPKGYEPHELPADYTGPLWIEGQVRRLHDLAAPTPRTPLTDEEIAAAAKSVPAAVYELMYGHESSVEKFRAALAEFARAIEAAHGITNQETN